MAAASRADRDQAASKGEARGNVKPL